MTLSRVIILAGLSLVLAACTSTFKSDVARFHNLPAPSGETFAIVATDPAKEGSLEFEQYAGMIRAHLSDLGYRAVADNPDITVNVDYYVSDGNEKVRSRPGIGYHSPFYGFGHFGHFGHFSRFSHFGHFGHFGYPGYAYGYNDYYSYTVYNRQLEMNMVRGDGTMIFEGRAQSVGRDNRLPEVMPLLVQALFTDFPGESGVTEQVRIKLADGNGY